MNCFKGYCKSNNTPISKYSWGSSHQVITYSCEILTRVIRVPTVDDVIFGTNCKAGQTFCQIDNEMLIWEKNIIKKCHIYKIGSGFFKVENKFIFNDVSKIGLQFNKFEFICNQWYLKTTEGIYLNVIVSFYNHITSKIIELH